MRRRLFVALLAAGLLLVAGFTAAAVASGGSPFGLGEDQQSSTADEAATDQDTLDRTTTEKKATEDQPAEDEKAHEKTTTDATKSNDRVTICHHTGSKKHPFHSITVDEDALAAHTGHGDTAGACPAVTASTAAAAKRAKPKHSSGKAKADGRSEQGQKHGNSQSHRPVKHAGGPSR